jgi:hypothetical protein
MRVNRKSDWKTPSRTSPKNSRRGCLCPDNTYNSDCCDGTLHAQGIGIINRVNQFLLLEDDFYLLQENDSRLLIENKVN